MNISLTPELDTVREKVKTGMYQSASEVIRQGLRLLQEQDQLRKAKLDHLRRDIDIGIERIERRQYTDYDADGLGRFAEEIIGEGRKRAPSHAGGKKQ